MAKYLLPSHGIVVFWEYLERAMCLASLPSIEVTERPFPYLQLVSLACTGTI